jgi:hypothetical protein
MYTMENRVYYKCRFATAETVCGTHELHAFMPVKKGVLNTKMYSASNNREPCD